MIKQRSLRLRTRINPISSSFVFEPSQQWVGNDVRWSKFIVRIGTPQQDFRILPATNTQEAWVPLPEGYLSTDPTDCGSIRGVEPFKGALSKGFKIHESSTILNTFLAVYFSRKLTLVSTTKDRISPSARHCSKIRIRRKLSPSNLLTLMSIRHRPRHIPRPVFQDLVLFPGSPMALAERCWQSSS